ncbi:Ankyrin repeat, partial [Dillenia turbinata]
MGAQHSKDKLLYQQVSYGNIEGIKALRREGACLESVDRDGRTPLILACMYPELLNAAKTLIDLGAKPNSYCPGHHAGTPLHHAAKRGLVSTVKLLLFHGANPLVMNDACQTALDVARVKGFSNVVRAIENHICLFSGWMRELYEPGFLEALASQLCSRKVWVVVSPCCSHNCWKPFKLKLAIYASFQVKIVNLLLLHAQDAQPQTVVALWKANMEEPKLNQPDPTVIILDNSTKSWIKLAAANENDKQQIQLFCSACKGITVGRQPMFLNNNTQSPVPAPAPPTAEEDLELAMAINASIQSAMAERPRASGNPQSSATDASTSLGVWDTLVSPSTKASSSGWAVDEASPSGSPVQHVENQTNIPDVSQTTTHENQAPAPAPSAPAIADAIVDDDPIHYPSIDLIDSGPVDLPTPSAEKLPAQSAERKDNESNSCVICLDAPIEGACIPCGHMAGCISCLKQIKVKKWGCPVCRAKIDQEANDNWMVGPLLMSDIVGRVMYGLCNAVDHGPVQN